MPTAAETIDNTPLLASLDSKARRVLAGELRERPFAAGDVITKETHGGVGFFMIGEGKATINVRGKPVGSLGPGDTFGEVALLASGELRTASIVAETDMQCWVLSQWHFKPLVLENPQLAWDMLKDLAGRFVRAVS